MGEVPKITDLHKIVEPYLEGGTLESYESSYLTKPGDNYGSLMLAIKAQIKQPNGSVKELPLIAKLPPLNNDLYWAIFHPERTCITENAVYKYLAPELDKLQLEAGVLPTELFDGFSRYYGSRISLDDETSKVDRDAVLVQENLTVRGYKPGDRHKPYDLAHTVLLLNYMAQYHALPIALRLKKPKVYEEFVRPYFYKFDMNNNMPLEARTMMKIETLDGIKRISSEGGDLERVDELLDLFDAYQGGENPEDGPFTSIVHGDMWINNMMVKYDETGLPAKLKFVDFQIAQYESLAHDIIFLLLSSVETDLLEQNYQNFLRIYYNAFIKSLRSVDVETKNYSYEAFLAEVQRVAYLQVPHAIFMTKVIKADNSTLPEEFKDVNMSVLTNNQGVKEVEVQLREILRLSKKFDIFY